MQNQYAASSPFPGESWWTRANYLLQLVINGGVLVASGAWVLNMGDGYVERIPHDRVTIRSLLSSYREEGESPQAPPPRMLSTVYIVDSQSEASELSAVLSEADSIRSGFALPAAPADMFVVARTDAEATSMKEALIEGNHILAANLQPELRIVDLRDNR